MNCSPISEVIFLIVNLYLLIIKNVLKKIMGCKSSKNTSEKENNLRISKPPEEKEKEKLYEIKVVLLGDQGVGKSSLVHRFCTNKFEDRYLPTIGGAYLQQEATLKNGDKLKLHLWDTSGQEKFRSMTSLYYKDAVAAVLVYDVSNPDSLDALDYWIKELQEKVNNEKFIITIAGNKCDLPFENKKVSINQGKNFGKERGVNVVIETSAKTGIGIQELFSYIAQKSYDIQKNG